MQTAKQQLQWRKWLTILRKPSKASCGLNRHPALCINKYPICAVYGIRFQTKVRIQIRHFSFMNYLSHHVLPNYNIYVNRSYFECRLVVFECYIPCLYFWNYLRTSLVSNWRLRICCQLTQHFTTVPWKATHMYCYLYIYISICFEILNSEYHFL